VVDDEVWPRAKALLENWFKKEDAAAWRCAGCGEDLEGQFGSCWKCGESRDA